MDEDGRIRFQVGKYLVIGKDKEWRVMEKFGAFRVQKKVFTTQDAAIARAERLERESE